MNKNISLEFENKTYTLEYTLDSIVVMEQTGFVADDLFKYPATMIPLLFYGAFREHHRGIKRKDVDRIYKAIPNRADLVAALVEMYRDTVTTAFIANKDEDAANEGNVTWTVNE